MQREKKKMFEHMKCACRYDIFGRIKIKPQKIV